jgi:hypothetical protein
MQEQAQELVDALEPDLAKTRNRGWFRAGDSRINRGGRPKSSVRRTKAASRRLMRILMPLQDLEQALSSHKHPWIVNLPGDFSVIAVSLDLTMQAAVVTIHSEQFPVLEVGEPIPEFDVRYNGLDFRGRRTRW